MIAWYAVHTRPHGEALAGENLDRQGYAVYLPRCRRWVRHARKRRIVLRPLFPRYLFVGIDRTAMPWRPIVSTIGVSDVVCAGNEPIPVAPEIVESLRLQESGGAFDELSPVRRLKEGDLVRVNDGPFRDFLGRLAETCDFERVCVLLEFLGRTVRARIPAAAIEAV